MPRKITLVTIQVRLKRLSEMSNKCVAAWKSLSDVTVAGFFQKRQKKWSKIGYFNFLKKYFLILPRLPFYKEYVGQGSSLTNMVVKTVCLKMSKTLLVKWSSSVTYICVVVKWPWTKPIEFIISGQYFCNTPAPKSECNHCMQYFLFSTFRVTRWGGTVV